MFRRPITAARLAIAAIYGFISSQADLAQNLANLNKPFNEPKTARRIKTRQRYKSKLGRTMKSYGTRYSHVLTEHVTEQNLRPGRRTKRK